MDITLEQIDLLRKRANVSYKEAKEVLEKCGGNVVDALASLEDENKVKPEKEPCCHGTFIKKTKSLITKINQYSIRVSKENDAILNLPLAPAILLTVISLPLAVAAIVLALITGCKIRVTKSSGEECEINKSIERFSDTVSTVTSKVAQEIKNA
jgi:hypothetical protein